jgi:SAM-dependent methyltransferase
MSVKGRKSHPPAAGAGPGVIMVKARACPVCGAGDLVPYKKATFNTGLLGPEQVKITDSEYGKIWDLSRCRSCGHIFADPGPNPKFLASLYSRVEDPQYEEETEGRSRNFLRLLDRLDKLAPHKGALLDVGAATGILLDLARRRGWRPDGIEISEWAVRVARRKYGLPLRQGDLLELDLPREHYAAVSMVDIIEHVPQPLPVAARAWEVLKPGGLLCLVTPDIHSLAAKAAGRRWWHLRPGHLAYFSWRSLDLLLRRTGFRVVKLRRYAWTFSAHYLLSRRPAFRKLAESGLTSFLKRIPIKLPLGDSFEIYARKVHRA